MKDGHTDMSDFIGLAVGLTSKKKSHHKNYERKLKSQFMIYADFESIIVPEDNGKQNPNKSFRKKYQKHIACSYGCKLLCVDYNVCKPFKQYHSS